MDDLNIWIDSISINRIEEEIEFLNESLEFFKDKRHYPIIKKLLKNKQKDLKLIYNWHKHRYSVKNIGNKTIPQESMNLKKYNRLVRMAIIDIEKEIKMINRFTHLSKESKKYRILEWKKIQIKIEKLGAEKLIC